MKATESQGRRVKSWGRWGERTDDVVVASPKVDVDGIEHSEQGKAPGNSVDDDAFSVGEELVDDGAQEEQVNQGPEPDGSALE